MKVKSMKSGEGFLDGLKSVGRVVAPVAKEIGKEVGKEAITLAKEGAKQAVREKMSSSDKKTTDKKGGFLVTAGTIGATLLANELMKKKGNGIYSAGVRMTPQQVRSLRRGGAITLKKEMLGDAGRFVMDFGEKEAKKILDALKKNKGVKMTADMFRDIVDMKNGGSIFGNVARVVAPIIAEKVIDKVADVASKKLEGAGIFTAGAGIFTAGAGVEIPIQTGSPYMLKSSPANSPYISSGLLTGNKEGSGMGRRGAGLCR